MQDDDKLSRPALIDGDNDSTVTYGELSALVKARVHSLGLAGGGSSENRNWGEREQRCEVAFLSFLPTVDAVVDYLAVRAAGMPVVLLDPRMPGVEMAALAERYKPTLVLRAPVPVAGYGAAVDDLTVLRRLAPTPPLEMENDVALLLSIPSPGDNPTMVQLSIDNLEHDAQALTEALAITADDRGLACLPLFEAVGLSVLHSHLKAGATTVLTGLSPSQAGFWGVIKRHHVTSIPADASSFEMFRQVGMFEMDLPSVRYVAWSRGRAPDTAIEEFRRYIKRSGKRLYRLYGRTEATSVMSVLSDAEGADNTDVTGEPVARGSFRIDNPDSSGVGQIVYSGPNVMLGYAEHRSDIGRRQLFGELATGDLGRIDDGGRLRRSGRVTGRHVDRELICHDRRVVDLQSVLL